MDKLNFGTFNPDLLGSSSRDLNNLGIPIAAANAKLESVLVGTPNADMLRGTSRGDLIFGLAGADTISGAPGNDFLYGGDGNDIIHGDQGNDFISGESGNDVLYGDAGIDWLVGGSGRDKFVIAPNSGGSTPFSADWIVDFTKGTDLIGLAGGLTFQNLSFVRSANSTLIRNGSKGDYLALVNGILPSQLSAADFTTDLNPIGTLNAVNLSVTPTAGTEAGKTAITITASASQAVIGAQTVNVNLSGTGITASDFTGTIPTQITIADGATSGSFTLNIADDTLVEGTETATFTISNPSAGLSLGATTSGNVTITDNDFPTVNLVVTPNTGTEAGTTAITVTANASQAVVGTQTVNVSLSGTGITASDFTGTIPTQITIANGATSGSFTLNIADDTLVEGTEIATFAISNPSAGLILGANTTGNVTITDNDIPTVNLSVTPNVGTEAGTTAITVTAIASQAVVGAQTINLNLSGAGITASDFTGTIPTQITIANGATSGSFTLNIADDALVEGTETATFTIANPSAGLALGANTSGNVTITDNDVLPTITNIDDGDADNTVTVGQTLTYTLTFNKDIDAATVTAADFDNAGTAAITIGIPTETAPNSGIFTLAVTPTTTGTVILRIPTGAVISDVGGNNLVVPVQDNDTITVNPVNQSPVLGAAAVGAITINEQTQTIISASGLGITDDGTTIASATIQMTGNFQTGQDVLSIVGALPTGINAGTFNPTTGTLTLTGSASLANYTTALQQIAYTNTSDAPNTSTRTVSFIVNDGNSNSNTVTRDITVQPVNDAPTRTPPTYTSNANLTLTVPDGANDLLTGATDPDGTIVTVVAATLTSAAAAATATTADDNNVTVNADGSFVYRAVAGFVGNDTFTYQLQDSGTPGIATTPVTATIIVNDLDGIGAGNSVLWFIDEDATTSTNLGTQANPFRSLAAFNAANTGIGNNPADTDFIFIGDDAGADDNGDGVGIYGGGITLRANQKLIGDGASSTLAAITGITLGSFNSLDAFSANRPTIAGGITLNTGNTLRGLTAGNAAGFSITGGAVGNLTISDTSLNNATGGGFNIGTSGALNVVLDSLSSNGGTNGVNLVGATGTFTANGGTIANPTGVAFNLNGGSANVTYGGTITKTNNANSAVSITARTGGTATFSGAIAATTSTANAINLINNTGSTINFTGALTISTTSGIGFNATGGGTVSATGTGSTITSTTGTALNVVNTTIGAGGLTFQSISANGATNGIVLNNTGTGGGLTVTGTGTAGSGGTIRNGGIGINLTNTRNVSLNRMQLNDFGDYAIRGTSVVGFTLNNTVISGINGNDAAADEGSVRFDELTGAASITNSSISGTVENQFRVTNTTGTLDRITFNNVTFGAMNATTGDDALLIESQNNAVMNVTVQNSFFTAARGDHFQRLLNGSGASDLVFTDNIISNTGVTAVSGGGGIRLNGGNNTGNNANATFNISNNTIRDSRGTALAVNKQGGSGSFSGTIANNTIGVAGVANSGSAEGSGIFLLTDGTGSYTATVTGNTVRQYGNFGIFMQTGGSGAVGSGTMNLTVQSNTISNPGTLVFAKNGIQLNAGVTPGDTYQVTLTLGGAGTLSNTITGSGTDGGTDFRLRQRQSTTVRLPGYVGANNDDAAVVAFVQGNNDTVSTPTGSTTNTVPTGGGFIG